jgi:hypothetical protein
MHYFSVELEFGITKIYRLQYNCSFSFSPVSTLVLSYHFPQYLDFNISAVLAFLKSTEAMPLSVQSDHYVIQSVISHLFNVSFYPQKT